MASSERVPGRDCVDRLRDLRRRYLAEETDLRRAVEGLQRDIDRWSEMERSPFTDRLSLASAPRLCDSFQMELMCMERDLAEVRHAVRGLDEEIEEIERAIVAWRTRRPSYHGDFHVRFINSSPLSLSC